MAQAANSCQTMTVIVAAVTLAIALVAAATVVAVVALAHATVVLAVASLAQALAEHDYKCSTYRR
jgi:hypothetical protein